ncbi:MAG: thermostable hemolysin [Gammaproteobacteria bacterium]|nr:thermostable hemolysin [Gammaproteobacteria bacterium]
MQTRPVSTFSQSQPYWPAPQSFNPAPDLRLHLVREMATARPQLESAIAQRFAREFAANIHSFMPALISLQTAAGPVAVAGCRRAAEQRLFLESYLDQPIEQALSAATGLAITRPGIVEIGNLASLRAGSARLLFALLAALLSLVGEQWIVCTVTREVGLLLSRMGLVTHPLQAADRARLGRESAGWGAYFQHQPTVVYAGLGAARSALQRHRLSNLVPAFTEDLETAAADWAPCHA